MLFANVWIQLKSLPTESFKRHHSKIIWGILYQDTSIWGKSFPPNGGLIPTGVPRPEHGEAPGERGRALCKPLSQLKSLGT